MGAVNAWDVDVDGVFAVLSDTEAASTELSTGVEGITAAQEALAGAAGDLTLVTSALADLVASESDRVKSISEHIAAGLLGAGNASLAYANADTAMAADIQSNALDAADSGEFSFFRAD